MTAKKQKNHRTLFMLKRHQLDCFFSIIIVICSVPLLMINYS